MPFFQNLKSKKLIVTNKKKKMVSTKINWIGTKKMFGIFRTKFSLTETANRAETEQQKKFQSGQSYSFIMRKVWYHQI